MLWEGRHEDSGGRQNATAGLPFLLSTPENGSACANQMIGRYGKAPIYIVDAGYGGHIIEALESRGCRVVRAHFGGGPKPAMPGQRRAGLNARATWYIDLADSLDMIALPESDLLTEDLIHVGAPIEVEARAIQRMLEHANRRDKLAKFKIRPKAKIKEDIGRSPDYGDALVLASSSLQSASGVKGEWASW